MPKVRFLQLHQAFQEGIHVRAGGGPVGTVARRRIADLVLPTGKMTIGYPGRSPCVDSPSRVHPVVPAGRYAVFISVVVSESVTFAFLTVQFSDQAVKRWEPAGSFFTDSGTGCVLDRSLTDALHRRYEEIGYERCQEVKLGALGDGDGSLILDGATGGNAIVFRTLDWCYDCYVGRDCEGRPACLVIDGRWRRWWEPWAFWR
jgi:hypothetical protein